MDGNHLRRTDRRIGELRELNAAPLPGQALVAFDPQYRLVLDVLPCEDGHAQERFLLPALLETVEPNDLWIADRNCSTVAYLTYNLLSVVRAAVHAVHGAEAAENLSTYYVSHEVAATQLGMSIILDGEFWRDKYSHLTPMQMAHELKRLAQNMRLSKYKKAKWNPTAKTKTKMNKQHRSHVSTARVLEESRSRSLHSA